MAAARRKKSRRPWIGFYLSIIAWETVTHAAKRIAVMALTLSMLMWLVAFLCVGAEWFPTETDAQQ